MSLRPWSESEEEKELLETAASSFKASIAVILVLFYGWWLRKKGHVTSGGESNISKLGTTFFLPALLFTEIGPLATPTNLKNYGAIIPFSLFFQFISAAVALFLHAIGMPQHYVPMWIFNNVTSLPLLLLTTLSQSGSLDSLLRGNETLAEALKRARVLILINALVGNMTRYALGPYLMKEHESWTFTHAHHDDPLLDPPKLWHDHPALSAIRLPEDDPSESGVFVRPTYQTRAKQALLWLLGCFNPPLLGGIAACLVGLITPLRHAFFHADGLLSPLTQSVGNMGALFTSLQMFILGAHLYSKKGSPASKSWMGLLFLWRFFALPAISISTIYAVRKYHPTLLDADPFLDFVLMIGAIGPPALTISAIADLAHVPPEVNGQVSQIITVMYAVTPAIALPITAALMAVDRSGVGK